MSRVAHVRAIYGPWDGRRVTAWNSSHGTCGAKSVNVPVGTTYVGTWWHRFVAVNMTVASAVGTAWCTEFDKATASSYVRRPPFAERRVTRIR
jgi:hypothetical protein